MNKKPINIGKPVSLVLQDGSTIDYSSLKVLASSLGVGYRRLHDIAKSGRYLDISGLMFVKVVYKDHSVVEAVPKEKKVVKKLKPKPSLSNQMISKPVVAIFEDGSRKEFASISDCMEDLGIARKTVNKALKNARPTNRGVRIVLAN